VRIELERVCARHPAARPGAPPALRDIDLDLAHGGHLAVIGPSGAGKTTLLQVAACALAPESGTLRLGGVEPWRLSRRALQRLRGELFLAPQVPPLPPRQRAVTAVLAGRLPAMGLFASLRSLVYPIDIAAAHEALDRFDVADKLFERVDRVSGGERQRIGLARALLAPAGLWLVDEPLSALDPARARQALSVLVETARERGVTLLVSLHDVEAALAIFPRILGLREGRVAFDAPAAEVTKERLERLYAGAERELHGPAPASRDPQDAPAPAIVQCR